MVLTAVSDIILFLFDVNSLSLGKFTLYKYIIHGLFESTMLSLKWKAQDMLQKTEL